ncbi:MAG: HNH endonuclease [Rhodoferax sp.]|nr:HNH endonuclease [Rhodoferax sp.]
MSRHVLNPLERTRLEKAAADCGFELSPKLLGERLVFRSAQFPECVTVESLGDEGFSLQASVPMLLPELVKATNGFRVKDWNDLYVVLDKAAATARTMPDRVAQRFHLATATLPKSTEAERLVVQRVGQNLFRSALLDYWQGRCCVTGLAVPELLRASHIRPWALCDTDEQRLDVFNGLLLSPNLDALFDGGWVTFEPTGAIVIAASCPVTALELLGVVADSRVQGLKSEHLPYLGFHRQRVFRGTGATL